ncbi:DUF4149 domain-containing protein [Desulfobulbus alkaliphilus]|uniref:DUF4149 domain-containing protein n=1 Tax=Desulfobulbus alkaliphilus TaxID=869814 RepID=UPI0019664A5B|nr:DUF4149 domain-containing protein [Desulfobulbus alkaliphilus]MBM9537900.1 DUF4149 domain-containing protein [Desulfobulbus alkaliphilus]
MHAARICYHLAIACWLGGMALFTFQITPAIFSAYSRDVAGGIVTVLFPGYFRWGLLCGVVALISRLLWRARFTLVSSLIIVIMLGLTATQAFILEPRAAELKKAIPSFETTAADDPRRLQFTQLHRISMVANLSVIAGGVVLVVLVGAPMAPVAGRRSLIGRTPQPSIILPR